MPYDGVRGEEAALPRLDEPDLKQRAIVLLEEALALLRTHGWCRGSYGTLFSDHSEHCAYGALKRVAARTHGRDFWTRDIRTLHVAARAILEASGCDHAPTVLDTFNCLERMNDMEGQAVVLDSFERAIRSLRDSLRGVPAV